MPALPTYLIDPIWEQFAALLSNGQINHHPLGCHRPRVPDRVVFEKLVQVLVLGCAYWRIANDSCSATTLHRGATSGSIPGLWPRSKRWYSKLMIELSVWSCPM